MEMMNRNVQIGALVVLALALGFGWMWVKANGRRPQGTDEQQIANLVASAGEAARNRESRGVLRHISRKYRDDNNITYPIVARQTMQLLNQTEDLRVEAGPVNVRVEPGGQTATADFHLKLTGRNAPIPIPMDTTMHLALKKEPVRYYLFFGGAEWKVTSASGYGSY